LTREALGDTLRKRYRRNTGLEFIATLDLEVVFMAPSKKKPQMPLLKCVKLRCILLRNNLPFPFATLAI
jgi:hypothetical protein